jgi:hypothetical protein
VQVFQSVRRNIEWLFIEDGDNEQVDIYPGGTGHGTCVLAQTITNKFGVAKNAKAVVVKFPPDGLLLSYVFRGLVKINQQILNRGLQGKAIINMSLNCKKISKKIPKILIFTNIKFL